MVIKKKNNKKKEVLIFPCKKTVITESIIYVIKKGEKIPPE